MGNLNLGEDRPRGPFSGRRGADVVRVAEAVRQPLHPTAVMTTGDQVF